MTPKYINLTAIVTGVAVASAVQLDDLSLAPKPRSFSTLTLIFGVVCVRTNLILVKESGHFFLVEDHARLLAWWSLLSQDEFATLESLQTFRFHALAQTLFHRVLEFAK